MLNFIACPQYANSSYDTYYFRNNMIQEPPLSFYADSVLGLIVVDERFPSLGDFVADGAESGVGRQRTL